MFILLFGCIRQSDNASVRSDSNETTPTTDSFDFTIRDGQIGTLKTGEQLTDVLEKLKTLTVVLDSIPECEACDTYSPLYLVRTFDNQ